MKNNIAISNEFLIQRIGQGIKLIKPNSKEHYFKEQYRHTVADFLAQPFNIWFSNTECAFVTVNDGCANICGLESVQASVGKRPVDFMIQKQAVIATRHDEQIMIKKTLEVTEFDLIRFDGSSHHCLLFKLPWYNDENKIIGTFGCGSIIGKHNLAEFLSKLISLDLLNINETGVTQTNFPSKNDNAFPYFSKRESQCLHLTVRGKPAKQVAIELGISQRTVEEHLNNIKFKLGVFSKAELIDKALNYFYELNQ
ncbi:LuxR family transcriptional regulator [Legionella steelei]|uniref:LuxR family transcriptional regulator n=1 Tax=Legionella steelei TaxID=947033 RepID=A0A0W0ZC35_9GAMM|nr:helix-turn-helix transcriptional regulator [Legionella steelei]KTD66705.1 LuxR family transcriptional regulator [Legionella steelei]